MRHIYICDLPGSIIFLHIFRKRHDFRNKVIEHKNVYFVFLYNVRLKIFLIIGRTELDMIKNLYFSACKVPVILVRF